MSMIDEHEVFARYTGETVNMEKLDLIAESNGDGYESYADSDEYIIAHTDYCDIQKYRKIFGLTDALTERWDFMGVDFRIYLYIRDNRITGGHVFKYITTSESCHFRPTGYETDATQQELRIVERILAYITSQE